MRGGSTLEVCLQLSWLANPTPVALDASLEFHSYGARGRATPHAPTVRIGAADAFARVEVGAPLRTERLAPKGELTTVERALRPGSATIRAGSPNLDVLPPSDAQLAADEGARGTQARGPWAPGPWPLGPVRWPLAPGRWALGAGPWPLGAGRCAVARPSRRRPALTRALPCSSTGVCVFTHRAPSSWRGWERA